ncbi:hypothetical protein D3C72_899350 [compost metagenome]
MGGCQDVVIALLLQGPLHLCPVAEKVGSLGHRYELALRAVRTALHALYICLDGWQVADSTDGVKITQPDGSFLFNEPGKLLQPLPEFIDGHVLERGLFGRRHLAIGQHGECPGIGDLSKPQPQACRWHAHAAGGVVGLHPMCRHPVIHPQGLVAGRRGVFLGLLATVGLGHGLVVQIQVLLEVVTIAVVGIGAEIVVNPSAMVADGVALAAQLLNHLLRVRVVVEVHAQAIAFSVHIGACSEMHGLVAMVKDTLVLQGMQKANGLAVIVVPVQNQGADAIGCSQQ